MTIEAAAAAIAQRLLGKDNAWKRDAIAVEEIIARHLFPLVKPEDVKDDGWYAIYFNNMDDPHWGYCQGCDYKRDVNDMIYGPVPFPSS